MLIRVTVVEVCDARGDDQRDDAGNKIHLVKKKSHPF